MTTFFGIPGTDWEPNYCGHSERLQSSFDAPRSAALIKFAQPGISWMPIFDDIGLLDCRNAGISGCTKMTKGGSIIETQWPLKDWHQCLQCFFFNENPPNDIQVIANLYTWLHLIPWFASSVTRALTSLGDCHHTGTAWWLCFLCGFCSYLSPLGLDPRG